MLVFEETSRIAMMIIDIRPFRTAGKCMKAPVAACVLEQDRD
jgi:hypothetical protein